MKVYVAEGGAYENRGVTGVFTSAEAAMAAHPGDWKRDDFEWEGRRFERWSRIVGNEAADDTEDIMEYDVQGSIEGQE